ncbi:MAG: FkbM family methyltransferase [Methylococcales bacterium]|nr:FkbM family methyltransferase [Methylococcales bacterium]
MINLSAHDLNENDEKAQIRQFFQNRPAGICVEVGANEPVAVCSQSLHLEEKLNWRCVLIEPNPILAQKAVQLRPKATVCEVACPCPENIGTMVLSIPLDDNNQEVTGHAALEKNADAHNYQHHNSIEVQADTLTHILQTPQIPQIDFLSIDVEGAEMDVLLGLDFSLYHPQLILLEDKHLYLKKHLFLKQQGYKLVRRLNGNCWYIPKESLAPTVLLSEKLKLLKRMYLSIWFKKSITRLDTEH